MLLLVTSGVFAKAKEFKLSNGMQVVVIQNNRAPVIAQMIWYNFGSNVEQKGKSGLAHFMEESMMVRGDEFYIAICNQTGCIAAYNENKNIFLSLYADGPLKFTKNIIYTNYESAEMTKISINMMLISSITMTNVLSEICEKINANWDEIKPSLLLDKRIGKFAYIRPGLGILSGNLQRDMINLNEITNKYKIIYLVRKLV